MRQLLLTLLPFGLPMLSLAQRPVITSVAPLANAPAAAPTGSLTVAFSQPLVAASAGALHVFSGQRGGKRTAAVGAVVNANTLSFTPSAYAYRPGERIQYTVTKMAASAGGSLARPRVGQFTAAVGGTGKGNFQMGSDPQVGAFTISVVVGDVDGDGDLDLVAGNQSNSTISVRLNAGNGTYSGSQDLPVGGSPDDLATADVDGDGDLDLLAAGSVLLNNGRGVFSAGQPVAGGYLHKVVMGDVDGDGDLDMLAISSGSDIVEVYLNNGHGTFGSSQWVRVGDGPYDLAIGDVDNDGDLDVLTANDNTNTVSVRLNDGNGTFSGGLDVVVDKNPTDLATGDVDGDGDLDFVVSTQSSDNISVQLNAGNGTFRESQRLDLAGVTSLALADVDADNDLDLLVTNVSSAFSPRYNIVNVRLNDDGSGMFRGGQDLQVGLSPRSIVAADVDGDGDLDLLTANLDQTVSVRLNGGTVLATATNHLAPKLVLFPNPAHGVATLTGGAPLANLTVLDALGRLVLHTTTDASGTAHLALPAELPVGVYMVRVGVSTIRWAVE